MRRLVPLVLLLVVFASACRVDATVRVSVRDDGSGVVSARAVLDADAVKAAELGGVKLEDAVRLGDLTAAGWRVSAWQRRKDGGAVLVLTKGFARAEDAGAVVAELSGPDGPLRNVRVTRDVSTFGTEWSFAGLADLKDLKTGVTTDADLVAKLTAERVDVAAVDQRLLAQTRDAFRLHVTADLPHAGARVYPVRPGTTVVMRTSSSETASGRILMLIAGVGVVVLAGALLLVGEVRHRRRRARA